MNRIQHTLGLLRLAVRVAGFALTHRRRPVSLAARLAAFPRDLPLEKPATIRWDDHQIPFVRAGTDRDLAVALGGVHVHLRLAQMEIMRRIAFGRVSEIAGPVAVKVDHSLRILDFPRAVPAIVAGMNARTRDWLEGFVDGVNAALAGTEGRPEEFALLDIEAEPWGVEDVVAVGQLAAADFSWRVWHRLHILRERDDWGSLWERLIQNGAGPVPQLAGAGDGSGMVDLMWSTLGRGGSNAAAVAGRKSATGSALLTSDPHLGIMAPGNWIATGLSSPSYDIAGLMIPGLPVISLGRNRRIAWSGTSMHAASSDLFDVTDLPPEEVSERQERIRIRKAGFTTVTVRDTSHGPIVTDAPLLKSDGRRDLALKWIGHTARDEISSMLAMMRADSWESFSSATEGFAAPALNLVFADAEGEVGHIMGAHLPKRPAGRPSDLVRAPESLSDWDTILTSLDLPRSYAPAEGFVASANNRPVEQTPVPIGFFFSPEERVGRLRAVLGQDGPIGVEDLMRLHLDVSMPSSPRIRDLLLEAIEHAGDCVPAVAADLVALLRQWDGSHDLESRGALAFELFLYHFLHHLHGEHGMAIYRASVQPLELMAEDMRTLPRDRIAAAAANAAGEAAATLGDSGNWGDFHRIRFAHPLAAAPLVGKRYVIREFGAGGSNETLMKTAHGLSRGRHTVSFGANARFIADMGDPNATWVVLLGGQDGWFGSSTFDDQIDLWRAGEYCRLPLDADAVAAAFRHETRLEPGKVAA